MKKTLFLFILIIFSIDFLFASNSNALTSKMQKYDKIFDRVSETRIGISQKMIKKVVNPFLVKRENLTLKKGRKNTRIYFRLDAILNNKAKINGRWIKLYHKIGSYKLIKIKKNRVFLKSSKITREILIRKKNGSKIQFSSK